VNGDEVRIEKFQAIDPYQRQFSYSFVDLVDELEIFVLDGNTLFQYEIEPFVSVNVTFNYVEVRNSTYGTEEGAEELIEDVENDSKLQEDSQDAGELKLDVQDNAVRTKKKANNNWFWWILGGTAVFLFINPFKTNQK